MELQLYLDTLKRRALVIIIVAVSAVAVVASAGLLITPVYTARATVRVLLDVGVLDLRLRDDYSERLLNTYTYILKSEPILTEAVNLWPSEADLTVGDLRDKVEVEVVPQTELISIAVEHGDPFLARDLANGLADLLVRYAQNLYVGSSKSTRQIVEEQLAGMENELEQDRQRLTVLLANDAFPAEAEALGRQIQFKEDAYDRLLDRYELARLDESLRANSITVVAPARTPSAPSNALSLKDIGLALIIGLFGGVGLALVLENVDTRFHSLQQLEHVTHLPVLGSVPKGLLTMNGSESVDSSDLNTPITEAYRLLALNLSMQGDEAVSRTILITSAMSSEGKSTVAAGLSRILAERGQTTFLLDADLRRPAQGRIFGINDEIGLVDLLTDRQSISADLLSQALQPVEQQSLFVIVGGTAVPNPTPLLAAPAMAQLVSDLEAQGKTTLLDAPPVLGMADVSILAPMVNDIILIVRQGMTKREHLLAAIKQLQAARHQKLALVFVQKNGKGWGYP